MKERETAPLKVAEKTKKENVMEDLKCPRCGHDLDMDRCARDNALAYGRNIYACPKCGKPFMFYRVVRCKELPEKYSTQEDDWGQFGRSYIKDKVNDDLNYNRIVRALGISSLKDEVEHIARKYDIAVSTVQASYTSKMCPVCGCIEDENRPNQETFECIECGHSDNADVNAAVNIRNRVAVTVLQQKLLKQRDNGAFEPKNLKRESVKKVLLSYRTSFSKGREDEKRKIS